MVLFIYMKNTTIIKFDPYNLIAIAGIAMVGYALWAVRGFLLMLVVALVISTFIEDFVARWEKYKIPRVASVFIFYTIMTLVFSGIIMFMVPVIITEVKTLSEFYPEISQFFDFQYISGQFDQVSGFRDILEKIKETPIEKLFTTIGSFFGGILNLVIIFIVSFYLSMQDHGLDRLLRIFTPKRYDNAVMRVWHNTQKKIGGWFRGQLIIAAILIVVTYIGLSIIGVPYALLLSLLAGLFGLVPYGIFIAILPAIGIGFLYGGWQMSLITLVFYMLVQQILDYGIQPFIFKKMTGIPSLMVILSVIIGAKLFGIAGLIIAIPTALFGLEIMAEIERHKEKLPE